MESKKGNDWPKASRQIAGLAGTSALTLKSGYLASNANLSTSWLCDLSLILLVYKMGLL